MVFTELALAGAFLIEPERWEDERGSFARTFCVEEFSAHGLNVAIAQCSVSYNRRRGTLRGLHYQAPPHGEDKLVRCTAGSAFDVVVDLRPGSVTFKRWCGVELSAANHRMLYVPAGFAHGFETLADDTELSYQMSTAQVPAAARILGWNDPAIGVAWPLPPAVMSAHDRAAGEAPESA